MFGILTEEDERFLLISGRSLHKALANLVLYWGDRFRTLSH